MRKIKIADIRIDGGTQMRASIDQATVDDYADRMAAGDSFPPVDLFHDGSTYWLADGFHRFHAARKAEAKTIDAAVHTGTQRDAVLFAVGANALHGLHRTNADKRQAVMTLLRDAEWSGWSNVKIALQAGVSDKTVSACRAELSSEVPKMRKVERNGKIFKQDTAKIGKAKPSPITPNPETVEPDADDLPAPLPEPPAPDDREIHNSAIQAALDHLEADARAVGAAIGHKLENGQHKLGNPQSAKYSTYVGTVGVLKDAAKAIRGNLIVANPENPGEYVSAMTATNIKNRLKALSK